ncbi:MAG: response regulator transcription factor [Candidatus Nanopelagicales bacterium]
MTENTAKKTSIALIDDHEMFRDGLARTLNENRYEVIWSGESAAEFAAASVNPDVVLIDVALRDRWTSGSDVAQIASADTRVVVLTGFPNHERIDELILAGALSVISKEGSTDDFLAVLDDALSNDFDITPLIASALASTGSPQLVELSPQEARVLALYGSGMKLITVAHHLDISVNTVKEYLRRVRRKLAEIDRPATTQLDLNREARRHGVLPD